jgi:hypothetical protein
MEKLTRFVVSENSLANLFQQRDSDRHVALIYLDREGNEARRINAFGFVPLHYESISLDSRNAGSAAVEVMEFAVARCEYQ